MRPKPASVIILLLSVLPQAFPGPPNIHSVCSKVSDSKGCISSVKSTITDGKAEANPATAMKAEIDALAAGVHAATAKAQALARDETLDPDTRTVVIPKCLAFYRDAVSAIDSVNRAMAAGDGELMHDSFTSIDSLASMCEDAFDAAHLPSPLKEENRVIGVAVIGCIGRAFTLWARDVGAFKSFPPSPSPSPSVPSLRHRGSAFPPSPASSPTSQRTLGPHDPLDLTAICSMTRDMPYCISAVQSVATGPLKTTNAAAVLGLTVNATIVSTRTAIAMAQAFSKAHADEPRVQDILNNVCAVKYRRAVRKLQEAEEAMAKGDKLMLKESLSVSGHYAACERAFADARLPRLMEDYYDDLMGLTAINLGIAKVFWPDPMFDKEYSFVLRDNI